jgi:hypothetical protein
MVTLQRARPKRLSTADRIGFSVYPHLEHRLVTGRPADELAALVIAERAGFVITFLDKGAGLFGSRRGSISYHVLTHATAPVLALPRP